MNETKAVEFLESLESVERFIRENSLCFLYISAPHCSVCESLFPKIQALLEPYPMIRLGRLDAEKVSGFSLQFSIYSAPSMRLFIDQREYLSEDRFISFGKAKQRIDELLALYEPAEGSAAAVAKASEGGMAHD